MFLFYSPLKSQKTLGLLLFPGGIKSEYWEEMGEFVSFILITKFKNRFFQRDTFSNWFWIFKWLAREWLLHRVRGVYKQALIGTQINTLQIQGVEITLIQCCFNVTTLKQR